MDENELKKCPWCGSEVEFYMAMTYGNGERGTSRIMCRKCHKGMANNGINSDATIVAAWNTRPLEDALTAEVAALRAEVDALKVERDFAIAAARTNDKAAKQMTAERDSQQRVCIRVMSELDALKEAARWVSVGERLPEEEGYYIVLVSEMGGVRFGDWETRGVFECIFRDGYWFTAKDVIAWRPLPAPPEASE